MVTPMPEMVANASFFAPKVGGGDVTGGCNGGDTYGGNHGGNGNGGGGDDGSDDGGSDGGSGGGEKFHPNVWQVNRRSWSGNQKAQRAIHRSMLQDSQLCVTMPQSLHPAAQAALDEALA